MEHAFGQLKSRWRCILIQLNVTVEKVNNIVIACCILHNLCKYVSDEADAEWIRELTGPRVPRQPEVDDLEDAQGGQLRRDPDIIRRTIARYLVATHGL